MITEKWQITLLGGVSARRGQTVVSRFSTRPTALLFARLAAKPGKVVTREELVELLWPESDPATARTRLRVALSSLRRQLEPPDVQPGAVLVTERNSAHIASDSCWVDAHQFKSSVEEGLGHSSQRQAIEYLFEADALYQGPFCDGLNAGWVMDESTTLSQLQSAAQMRLAQLLSQTGDMAAAIRQARRAVEADPLSEPARRVLIRLMIGSGQTEDAAAELAAFRRFFMREVGLEPSPETLRILEAPVRAAPTTGQAQTHEVGARAGARLRFREALPRFSDAFVERPDELACLGTLICMSRLVTLIGPAGVGKSRLAIEVARAAQNEFAAGIWFVPVPNEYPEKVLDLVASALDPQRTGLESSLETTRRVLEAGAEGLGRKAALLVLDGADLFGQAASREIIGLIREVPSLTLLLTSRRRLAVVGEQEYQVLPLETPEAQASLDLGDLVRCPSVRLFVERVRKNQPDFQLNYVNAEPLARICRALQGIPLAIELAAAQVRRRPLASIADELSAGNAPTTISPRSLQTAIASSFDSLTEIDHRHLLALTIFDSDFDLTAAESVLETSGVGEILESLSERSLLSRQSSPSGYRYQMLASIRDFGAKRMAHDMAEEAAKRHAAHYRLMAVRFASAVNDVGPYHFLPPDSDWANIRTALLWHSREPDRMADLSSMVASLTWYFVGRGRIPEGLHWVGIARQGYGKGLDLTMAKLLISEATLGCYRDDAKPAVKLLSQVLPRLDFPGGAVLSVTARWSLGFAKYLTGDYEGARNLLIQSLKDFQQQNSSWWAAATHNVLGFTECAAENLKAAEAHFASSIELWKAIADRTVVTHSDLGLARVLWKRGCLEEARSKYHRCLEDFRRTDDRRGISYAIEGLARVATSAENYSLASRLLGIAQMLRESQARKLDASDAALRRKTQSTLEQKLGPQFEAEWRVGHSLTPGAGIEYASSEG